MIRFESNVYSQRWFKFFHAGIVESAFDVLAGERLPCEGKR